LRHAESVARNISGPTISGSPIPWLTELVRLPAFDPRQAVLNRNLWPLPIEHTVLLPPSVVEAAARQGAEMRRIGEAAAQREAEKQISAVRKIG
jgi:hypothetical protein